MNDVRDEAIGALLERAAVGIGSAPVDGLPEVLRRGGQRRVARFTAIGAAVAMFVGAVSWAGLTFPTDIDRIPADIRDWRTFASLEENGWTIKVPPPWRVQELPACATAPERIGVSVTNTDFVFRNPKGELPRCADRHVFVGFPRDGVVFQFQPWGDFGLILPQPSTDLPLSADLLESSGGIKGGPSEKNAAVWVGGRLIGIIHRYVGSDASAADVAALDRMLASFRVRSVDRWTETGEGTTLHDEARGYAITYPDGWTVADENLTPWLSSPSETLSLGTFQLRVSEHPDDGFRLFDAPVAPAALRDMRSDDAFISLQESTAVFAGSTEHRPDHFGPLGCDESIYGCHPSAELPEAWRNAPFRAWWIPFKDAGRAFYLFVAIGTEATPELRRQAWAVADSLSFDPARS
jgi:hypothetical protein